MAPGTLFQVMVTDELLTRVTWTDLTGPRGSAGERQWRSLMEEAAEGAMGEMLGIFLLEESHGSLTGGRDLTAEGSGWVRWGRRGFGQKGQWKSEAAGDRNLRDQSVWQRR